MNAHLLRFRAGSMPPLPPGTRGSCLLQPVDGGDGWLLALTPDPAPWAVEDVQGLPHAAPAFASVVEFDGPRDAVQVRADQRSGRERIWPASAQVDGTAGAVVLRAPDGGMWVAAFADSTAAIDAAVDAILSTPLLPGEDPTLLRDPDRQSTCAVTADDGLTALLRDAATAGARA